MKKRIFFLSSLIIGIGIIEYWNKKSINWIKTLQKRYLSYYNLTSQWLQNHFNNIDISEYFIKNNYRNIAIYGKGSIGELFYSEIKNKNIKVQCFIDQNIEENYNIDNVKIIGLHDLNLYEQIDVIVITPIFDYDKIVNDLVSINCVIPIISLEKVIFQNF